MTPAVLCSASLPPRARIREAARAVPTAPSSARADIQRPHEDRGPCSGDCREREPPSTTNAERAVVALDFRAIYERWFDDVSRWIRAMGGPEADREDLVQDVFLVVHRRLPDFDGQNLAGWLYQIARRRVRDFRRLMWVKHLLFGSASLSENLIGDGPSPVDAFETTQRRVTLERLLYKLHESERFAFVLFEIDGFLGEEIAEVQGVSVNTVWARIYRARRKLKASFAKLQSQERCSHLER